MCLDVSRCVYMCLYASICVYMCLYVSMYYSRGSECQIAPVCTGGPGVEHEDVVRSLKIQAFPAGLPAAVRPLGPGIGAGFCGQRERSH